MKRTGLRLHQIVLGSSSLRSNACWRLSGCGCRRVPLPWVLSRVPPVAAAIGDVNKLLLSIFLAGVYAHLIKCHENLSGTEMQRHRNYPEMQKRRERRKKSETTAFLRCRNPEGSDPQRIICMQPLQQLNGFEFGWMWLTICSVFGRLFRRAKQA